MAAVLGNGGGFYHPFAYVAEAMRMGLTVHPPDVNASDFRCTGRGRELRIGLQFVKGLSAEGAERILSARGGGMAGPRGGEATGPRGDGAAGHDRGPGDGGHASLPHPERSEGSCTPVPDTRRQGPSVVSLPRDEVPQWAAVRRPTGAGHRPFRSLFDLRSRTGLAPDDLRALIKVGALDSIADGWTRPMMLWMIDAGQRPGCPAAPPPHRPADWFDSLPPAVPVLKEYSAERRRREEYAALGFVTDSHPMRLHADRLARFTLCRSTDLPRHVGRHVMMAGMLTTAKPVHTLKDEPMEFATFDDGDGLIETVLFPRVYRERGHILFDQGPFIFRGKVEQEFGVITVTITHLDRLERAAGRKPGELPSWNGATD
jgi:DNA polymerase III alpha subunit